MLTSPPGQHMLTTRPWQQNKMTAEQGPEIFIGLCGALGTDLGSICRLLDRELHAFGYKTKVIRLSEVFARFRAFHNIIDAEEDEYERIKNAMDAGNKIREIAGSDGAARLAIAEIRHHREEITPGSANEPAWNTAYIIRSLKHEEESVLLRRTYQDSFVQISVYEPKDRRVRNLAIRAAKQRKTSIDSCLSAARELVARDEKEIGVDHGQDVRDVFPLADVFLEANTNSDKQISRLARIMFGAPFMTPRRDEFSMYHAHAAALKSADLSRQVGAVIVTDDAEIIASGCNEVPKVGGGMIWGEDIAPNQPDRRDYSLGFDTTAIKKREMLREIVKALRMGEWLAEEFRKETDDQLIDRLLSRSDKASLRDSRVANVIEFGRIVHAEMSAIMDAARRGLAVKDKTLFCTTFPCHMCARHIIAAGVRRVVFIEPYPKSMAKELYESEILVDDELTKEGFGVRFEPFVGVAPRRYAEWFTMGDRKDGSGYALPDSGSIGQRKVSWDVYLPPKEEAGYEDSLSVLSVLDTPPAGDGE